MYIASWAMHTKCRGSMQKLLKLIGFSVTGCRDGEDALSKCREELPDGILLDLNMPHMNGQEFLEHLRKFPGGDKPKVLLCSGMFEESLRDLAARSGANGYITKPVGRAVLEQKLREVGLL